MQSTITASKKQDLIPQILTVKGFLVHLKSFGLVKLTTRPDLFLGVTGEGFQEKMKAFLSKNTSKMLVQLISENDFSAVNALIRMVKCFNDSDLNLADFLQKGLDRAIKQGSLYYRDILYSVEQLQRDNKLSRAVNLNVPDAFVKNTKNQNFRQTYDVPGGTVILDLILESHNGVSGWGDVGKSQKFILSPGEKGLHVILSNKYGYHADIRSGHGVQGPIGGGWFKIDMNVKHVIVNQSSGDFGLEPRIIVAMMLQAALPDYRVEFFPANW